MTINVHMHDIINEQKFDTEPTNQVEVILWWLSRKIWYNISTITFTHNEEYPTPAINITAPGPGIRFTVTDQDGNTLYTNVKPKEEK